MGKFEPELNNKSTSGEDDLGAQKSALNLAFHQMARTIKLLPLWAKVTFSLLITLMLVALIAGELMRLQLKADYSASLRNTSENTFILLSAAALEPVISEDIPQLRSIVNETGRLQADIYAIRVFNEEGVLLASSTREARVNNGSLVSFSKDIVFESEVFGTLEIDWSTEGQDQEVLRHTSLMRYWVIASLLLLTSIIILLIHIFAVRPISRIHQHLLELNKGELTSRVSVHNSRELSLLSHSVNDLADALELQKRREVELESAKRELFEAKEMAEITLHSIGDGVISTDVDGNVQYLNPISEKLTGWTNDEARGSSIEDVFKLVDEINRLPLTSIIYDCLEGRKPFSTGAYPLLIAKNGQESAVANSGSPIRNRHGKIIGAVMIFHDVTESRDMTRLLQYQASHDSLTNLINRKEFDHRLLKARESIAKKEHRHTLLYIDLDQFKIVNDTCGHSAGDELLKQLATLISSELRRGDLLARLGGDEFGVLLLDCPLDFGIEVAEAIRRVVEDFRFVWNDAGFSIGTSIGIVAMTIDSPDSETLLEQADEACYSAKELGRNRYHIYAETENNLIDRQEEMNWLAKVNAALAEDRFVLYFQTVLPLANNCKDDKSHIEILIRMLDTDGSLVSPGAFISSAERYGLMPKVDYWVIEHTLAFYRKHPDKMDALVLCNINLSGKSLSDESLLNYLEAEFDKPDIDPSKFCFELTETAAVSNLSLALKFMQRLQQKGCLFALDDFGSGMSSFGYLKSLPVDFLKIDGMFVKDIVQDKISMAMVASINEVGHMMGKQTIAEFVEDEEILSHLREMGVDFAQGYHISKPQKLT